MRTKKQLCFYMLSLILLLSAGSIFAQGTSVGNDEVIVVSQHDAKIKDADKISVSPNVPQMEVPAVKLDYTIPSHDYKELRLEPSPLKPIALSKEKLERFNRSYIKLGFGSQLSPLAEVVYNGKSGITHFGVDASHFSAFPQDIKNQQFHNTKAGAYLRVYPATYLFGADFRFQNYITHFYGLQNAETQTMKQIRQIFQDFDGKIHFANAQKNKIDLDFNSGVQFNYFRELAGKSNELFIRGNVGLYKNIKQHTVGGSFDADVSRYQVFHDSLNSSHSHNLWRQLYWLKLHYGYSDKNFLARAAFTFGLENINNTTKFYPLPDLYFQARLYQKAIHIYAGWNMQLMKNSFRNFAQENNFIQSDIQLENSRVSDVYGGLKGAVSGFSYKAQFSYKYVWNQAFYYTGVADVRRFQVGYFANMQAFNPHLELGYNYRDAFMASLSFDYNRYIVPGANAFLSPQRAWYMPDFTANLRLRYTINQKVIVGADVYGFTAYHGFLQSQDIGFPNPIFTQKGTADANLSVEYLINKQWSVFGNLNNIANQKYQRWANYPVFGINGLVGGKFSF